MPLAAMPALVLAIDLGTTSLCWRALNAQGTPLAEGRALNPQAGAGADIMSRLAVASTAEGRELLAQLVRGAKALGANQLTLEVRVSNQGAQDLYRQFGFAPGGARKAYYADNGEDALVMWAHEVATPDYDARLEAVEAAAPWPVERVGFDAAVAAPAPIHPALAGIDAAREEPA